MDISTLQERTKKLVETATPTNIATPTQSNTLAGLTIEAIQQFSVDKQEVFKPIRFFDLDMKENFFMYLAGAKLITHSEILTIAGAPGMGKSQIVEAIICAYILAYYDIDNHNINLIEFEVSVKEKKPILIFDLERTPADISKSLRRIVKRLNNIVSTEQIKAVIHYDQVMASELEDKAINGNESEYFKYLESVCDQYGCVIIEGVIELGGLDMNSAEKNGSNIKKIRQISGKNNVPIITTAHLNKGKAGEKTNIQGHTGSFLLKWSRAVIRTYCKPGFSKVQSLAADKLSHDDKNKIDVFHYYDESVGLRISTEDAEPTNPKDLSFFKNLPDQWQKYSIIRKSFEVQTGYHSKKVWQDYLTLAIDKNIIEKRGSTNSSEIRRKAD